MAEPRYVIIHGHFYQPPRESPWTGLIAAEAGAAPFPNWNERILSECYIANAHAHTMEGTVVHVRNNYESLNFDFGPTLAAWMERHGKPAYRAIKLMTEQLAGFHIDRQLKTDKIDYVLLCKNDSGNFKVAVWTTGEPHPVSVEVPPKFARHASGVTGTGEHFPPHMEGSQLTIELEALPKYVSFK